MLPLFLSMKVYFISLGCDKNSVDTSMMLGILDKAGHVIVMDVEDADAVVINTCAFIQDAKKESIDTILEMEALKNNGTIKYIVVTGCLAERYKDEIEKSIPSVDVMLGIQGFDQIAQKLKELEDGIGASNCFPELSEAPICGKERMLTGQTHFAYMKIAEGCNKRCTYCAIPRFRGLYRSVPMDTLIAEATELAGRGVKELILVAQETTIYGVDLYGEKKLPEVLRNICKIDGIEIVRILYCYPEEITDELIDVIATEPKIAHYIDMPIQSGSDEILKRMGRRAREGELRELIAKLRERIPDICIRTTLIAGFPGETNTNYKETLRFVEDMRFDRLGVFTYSPEEGTVAATMNHQVPGIVKTMRRNGIMRIQQKISYEKAKECIGRRVDAIVDGKLIEDGVYVCRTYRDVPDVDGYVFVQSDRDILSGSIIKVEIVGAKEYDLIGEEVTEE